MFSRQPSPAPSAGGVDDDRGVALLSRVLTAVSDAGTDQAVVDAAVAAVRGAAGWEVVRAWRVDSSAGVLVLWPDSGRSATDATRLPDSVTLAKGQGVTGQAWTRNELVLAEDLAGATRQASDAATAREFRSSLGVPLAEHGKVVGVLEFSSVTPWRPSPERMQLMRTIGVIVSQALERVATEILATERGKDMAAVNAVLREITTAGSETAAIQVALDTIRREFGWEYGSYWSLDPAERVLRNAVESGNAGEEFRQVTRAATFAEGVGVAGRAWKRRDMVFEPDLGGVKDCVRAPAAQRAGVKSGVCLPIIVHGDVVGTMDFFTTRSIHLSAAREDALRNTAFLVSNAIEQTRGRDRVATAGEELLSSITEVERNVIEASNVAADAQRLTEEASKIVASLNTSSVEIGNVVKVITSIAEQTNLLALNATIEAARAGDSGKGFAVVASEVKDLARETAKATEEVDSKVSAIQSDANSVVQALEGVARTVARINEAQDMISGVLTEQSAVTRSVLGQ